MKRKLNQRSANEQRSSRIQSCTNGYGYSRPSASSTYFDAGYPAYSNLDANRSTQNLRGYRGYTEPVSAGDAAPQYGIPTEPGRAPVQPRRMPVEFYPPYPYSMPVRENVGFNEQVRPPRFNGGISSSELDSRRRRQRPFGSYYEMPTPYHYEQYNQSVRPFLDQGWGDAQYSGRDGYGNRPQFSGGINNWPYVGTSSSAKETELRYHYPYANSPRPAFPTPYQYHPDFRNVNGDAQQELRANIADISHRSRVNGQRNFETFRYEEASEKESVEKDTKKQRRVCIIENCTKFAQGITRCCTKHGGGKRCLTENCGKGAVGSTSYCVGHGGGKRCTQEGCNKSAIPMYSFCFSHGGGKRCKREGCTKGARATTSYCIAHGGGKRCSVPGCSKSDQGSGFCIAHGGGRKKRKDGSSIN